MRGLLAAIPFVFPVFVAAQDSGGSVKDAPARITPEMKAKTETIARALEGLTPEASRKRALLNALPKPTCTRRSTAGPNCFNPTT